MQRGSGLGCGRMILAVVACVAAGAVWALGMERMSGWAPDALPGHVMAIGFVGAGALMGLAGGLVATGNLWVVAPGAAFFLLHAAMVVMTLASGFYSQSAPAGLGTCALLGTLAAGVVAGALSVLRTPARKAALAAVVVGLLAASWPQAEAVGKRQLRTLQRQVLPPIEQVLRQDVLATRSSERIFGKPIWLSGGIRGAPEARVFGAARDLPVTLTMEVSGKARRGRQSGPSLNGLSIRLKLPTTSYYASQAEDPAYIRWLLQSNGFRPDLIARFRARARPGGTPRVTHEAIRHGITYTCEGTWVNAHGTYSSSAP